MLVPGLSRSDAGVLFAVVTVGAEVEEAEGSVMVLRDEANDCRDQSTLQKPMNRNRSAKGWRQQLMRTSSKKKSQWTRSMRGGFPFKVLRPEYTSGLANLRRFCLEAVQLIA